MPSLERKGREREPVDWLILGEKTAPPLHNKIDGKCFVRVSPPGDQEVSSPPPLDAAPAVGGFSSVCLPWKHDGTIAALSLPADEP